MNHGNANNHHQDHERVHVRKRCERVRVHTNSLHQMQDTANDQKLRAVFSSHCRQRATDDRITKVNQKKNRFTNATIGDNTTYNKTLSVSKCSAL
jgi:hypothetical protein